MLDNRISIPSRARPGAYRIAVAEDIGFRVVLRAAFADSGLSGSGSGLVIVVVYSMASRAGV